MCIPSETTFDMLLFGSTFDPDKPAAQGLLAIIKNSDCVEVTFDPDRLTDFPPKLIRDLRPDEMLVELNRHQILAGYTAKLSAYGTLERLNGSGNRARTFV